MTSVQLLGDLEERVIIGTVDGTVAAGRFDGALHEVGSGLPKNPADARCGNHSVTNLAASGDIVAVAHGNGVLRLMRMSSG